MPTPFQGNSNPNFRAQNDQEVFTTNPPAPDNFSPPPANQVPASPPSTKSKPKNTALGWIAVGALALLTLGVAANRFGSESAYAGEPVVSARSDNMRSFPQNRYYEDLGENEDPTGRSPFRPVPPDRFEDIDNHRLFERFPEDFRQEPDHDLEELSQKVSQLERKTWLLAMANNENVELSKRLARSSSQTYSLSGSYISITPEWKLSRLPTHLRLSERTRKLLVSSVDTRSFRICNPEPIFRNRVVRQFEQQILPPVHQPEVRTVVPPVQQHILHERVVHQPPTVLPSQVCPTPVQMIQCPPPLVLHHNVPVMQHRPRILQNRLFRWSRCR